MEKATGEWVGLLWEQGKVCRMLRADRFRLPGIILLVSPYLFQVRQRRVIN